MFQLPSCCQKVFPYERSTFKLTNLGSKTARRTAFLGIRQGEVGGHDCLV